MDNKKFSETIVRLRKEKGLTQAEVAEKLNVSAQAVSKWENGDSFPDVSLLLPLAELYGVSVDELLGRVKPEVVHAEPADEPVDLTKLFFRVQINATGEDRAKINVNLPFQLLEVIMDAGGHINIAGDNKALQSIDFRKLILLAQNGALGNLVELEADDATIRVFVEKIK